VTLRQHLVDLFDETKLLVQREVAGELVALLVKATAGGRQAVAKYS
jgi:hypothetical protein